MLSQFRTYTLAVDFHRSCRSARMPNYLKTQLLRSASSVALNLAEGYGKPTVGDQIRFYSIAMGSLRESQAALDLATIKHGELIGLADHLGASLYKLLKAKGSPICS